MDNAELMILCLVFFLCTATLSIQIYFQDKPVVEEKYYLYSSDDAKYSRINGFNVGRSLRCIVTGSRNDSEILRTDVHEACHALIEGADTRFNYSHWCKE